MHKEVKEVFVELKELLVTGSKYHECLKLWCNEHQYRGMRRVHEYNQMKDYKRACELDEFILNQPYNFKIIEIECVCPTSKIEIPSYKNMLELYKMNEKATIQKLRKLASKLREVDDFTGYCHVYDILEDVEQEYNKICITLEELTNYGWEASVVYTKDKYIHDHYKKKDY